MALYEALNNETYIRKRDEWYSKFYDMFAGTYHEDKALALWGYWAGGTCDPIAEPERFVDEALKQIADGLAEKVMNPYRFAPVCVDHGIYGVHYVDKICGANVFRNGDQWYTEHLKTPIGSLEMPDLDTNETFQISLRAAKRFVEVGGKFPYYDLPTIASTLNIAINLYGEAMLVEMIENPDNARKDLETITELLVRIHQTFKQIIPKEQLQFVCAPIRIQPVGYGQICGCSTHLLSGELYRDLIADLDERVLGVYEKGGMIHLCGMHTQHIETFRNMKTLSSVQLNDRASDDYEQFFKGLREDQIIYLNPSAKMPAERAIEISGGKRLVIVEGVERDLPLPTKA